MTAYQCDICGKFYNQHAYDENAKINPFTGAQMGFERKTLAVVGEQIGTSSRYNDVCPNCMNAIQKVCKRINKEGTEWIG